MAAGVREVAQRFAAQPFFVLRAPALPFTTLRPDDGDGGLTRAHVAAVVRDARVREALAVASPDVDAKVDAWLDGMLSPAAADKLAHTCVRYVQRMSWRGTPFGLFAGVAMGRLGARTHLELGEPTKATRHTTLDGERLESIRQALLRLPTTSERVRYRPNDHLLRHGRQLTYVTGRPDQPGRHRRRTIRRTEAVDTVLARAAAAATAAELVEALVDRGAVSDRAAARALVDALVANGLLVGDFELPVIGGDALERVAAWLTERSGAAAALRDVNGLRTRLRAIDSASSSPRPSADYRALAAAADALAGTSSRAPAVHAILRHHAPGLELDGRIARDALRGVAALARLHRDGGDPLRAFAQAFVARWGEREVPLLEALDEVVGVGFDPARSTIDAAPPLVRGLALPSPPPRDEAWTARDRLLASRVFAAATADLAELVLADDELESLPAPATTLPDSFAALVSLHADGAPAVARGDYRVQLRRAVGPSATALLGRFCVVDDELLAAVRALAAREDALTPDAIAAEVVHAAHPRSLNVASRPALRGYEIAVQGASASTGVVRVPLADLTVTVVEDEVQLRWHSRRVLPRLSYSDNIELPSLPAYRFLACVARAGTAASLAWDWGPLASLPRLPRVVYGRCILVGARWRLDAVTLAALAASGADSRVAAVAQLRRERRLPRWTMVVDRDLTLPIDWQSSASVDAFLDLAPRGADVVVEEMFPGPGRPLVDGADGPHAADLVIPYLANEPRRLPPPVRARAPSGPRRSSAATGWLSVKLYCSEAGGDRALLHVVEPVVAARPGAFDRWFFVRYGDPDHHLRVRFHGDLRSLHADLVPALRARVDAVADDGCVHRLAVDEYDPEWERYGGAEAMPLVEELFAHDSEAALGIALAYPAEQHARWMLGLRGMHGLFEALVPDVAERAVIAAGAQRKYAAALGLTGRASRALGATLRAQASRVTDALRRTVPAGDPLHLGSALLTARDARIAPRASQLWRSVGDDPARRLRARIVTSIVHMHANRVLPTQQRLHEALLCHFLVRVFEADARAAGQPGQARKNSA